MRHYKGKISKFLQYTSLFDGLNIENAIKIQ